MDESKPSLELRDIPDVTPLLPREWWPWWAWVAMVAGLLVLWSIIIALRKSQGSAASQRAAAFLEAQQALEQAKSLTNAVTMSTALSLALRRYLAIALGDSSLFETHEEFLARHDALASLPESIRHSLSEHFSTLCRYKYAPCEETVDLSLLVPQASTLLHQIHAVEPRPAPAAP
jgi:hypothetical protein